MPNQLKLDIIVNDHGAVRVLQQVDQGMAKIAQTARGTETGTAQLGTSVATLSRNFGGMVGLGAGAAGALLLVKGAVDNTLESVDKLDRLSGRLGDSVENVQRLQALSADSSVSIDSMAGAIQHLQIQLAGGEIGDELDRIGLSTAQLRGLAPTEMYLSVAGALGTVADQSEKARLAQDLLGRGAKELSATFRDDVNESARAWLTVSSESVAGLDAYADGWDKAKTTLQAFGVELLATMTMARSYAEWMKVINGEQATFADRPGALGTSRDGNIGLASPPRFGPRPDVSPEMMAAFRTGIDAYNTGLAEADAYQRGLVTHVAALADGWVNVWDRVKEVNAEMRVSLTLEGQRLNNAIAHNAIIGANARSGWQAEIDKLTFGGVRPDDPVADLDRRLATVDRSTAADFAAAENDIIAEWNMELVNAQNNMSSVASETDKVKASAEGVLDVFSRINGSFTGPAVPKGFSWEKSWHDSGEFYNPIGGPMQRGGAIGPSWGERVATNWGGGSTVNNFNISGVMASDLEQFRQAVQRVLTEDATIGRKFQGAR